MLQNITINRMPHSVYSLGGLHLHPLPSIVELRGVVLTMDVGVGLVGDVNMRFPDGRTWPVAVLQ